MILIDNIIHVCCFICVMLLTSVLLIAVIYSLIGLIRG